MSWKQAYSLSPVDKSLACFLWTYKPKCVWPLLCHVAACAFPLVGMLDFVIGATYKERTPMEHLIANCCDAWWCSVLKHLSHSSGFYFLEHLCKASTGATLAFTDPSDART